ncbi:hypothetical protein PDN50_22905 [Bacillus cereus]|nr:hypothetical protein [Bacillus cereus]MDA2445396.1 hypothetical protein [Bacillus cereus]HDR4481002.1 hypothetical protein [Bacillus cereus]
MILHRDCIFYKYSGTPNWGEVEEKENGKFCSFSCESYQDNVLKVNLTWLDPIKVRDKIITTERKSIFFFVFESNKTICIFGSSESQIAYTISKLLEFFSINFKKINLFDKYKDQFLESTNYNGLILTSFDIAKQQYGFDDNTYINISLEEIKPNELLDYINSYSVISFVTLFEEKKLYFSLDLYSVISFFDTDEPYSIYCACERIVKDIV